MEAAKPSGGKEMNRMAQRTEGRWDLERYVDRKITALQYGLLTQQSPQARSQLARLRQANSKGPGESPDTWDVEFAGLPESLRGRGDAPATAGEWAVHLALTLYAIHQQSLQQEMHKRTNREAREWRGIGNAVSHLVYVDRQDGRGEQLSPGEMPRRFSALVTSESVEELAHYARQLVSQLRRASIPLDYARFAGQIYEFQNPYRRERIRLEWAREFTQQPSTGDSSSSNDQTTTEQ